MNRLVYSIPFSDTGHDSRRITASVWGICIHKTQRQAAYPSTCMQCRRSRRAFPAAEKKQAVSYLREFGMKRGFGTVCFVTHALHRSQFSPSDPLHVRSCVFGAFFWPTEQDFHAIIPVGIIAIPP